MPTQLTADVFIAGSGPIGATLAKMLIDAGKTVIIAEQGSADSFTRIPDKSDAKKEVFVPGSHKKNTIEYQKDIDRFVYVIKSALSTVSVPVSHTHVTTLDPVVWGATGKALPPVSNGKNPKQEVEFNLGAEAVTRGVGGMSTHWTCATPRFHKTVELPSVDSDPAKNVQEWSRLYRLAEGLIGTTRKAFDKSIRHNIVLHELQKAYGTENVNLPEGDWPVDDKTDRRIFGALPLACERLPNPDYVLWHAADTIFAKIYEDEEKRKKLTLLTNTGCKHLVLETEGKVKSAMCFDYLKGSQGGSEAEAEVVVTAKHYIIAAGAVATPQILFNTNQVFNKTKSLFPNLGKYITEQPMAFCQIILKKEFLDKVPDDPYKMGAWWSDEVKKHIKDFPNDPLKFPFSDAEPQVTTPVTEKKPWHTQIHRDAFSYGAVAATIDTRTIVDFRFFGITQPNKANTITFETEYTDAFGMPQPTFHFELDKKDAENAHNMMTDMCDMASKLGGYLPGSEPQFMEPGLALHLGGTVRAGADKNEHVADVNCKVHDFTNLYVGGNGVIPTGFAANPTLTSIGYAIRTAEFIIKQGN